MTMGKNRDTKKKPISSPFSPFTRWTVRLIEHDWDETKAGDYLEILDHLKEESGFLVGRLRFWKDLVRALFYTIINSIYWRFAMLKNYFRITFRTLWKNKMYSAINILGLAAGLTCTLLIFTYVTHEMSYDRHHEYSYRIHRIAVDVNIFGDEIKRAIVGPPTAAACVADFPEVEDAVRLKQAGTRYVRYGEKSFKERSLIFSDPSIFNIFTIPLLDGSTQSVLANPFDIVLSRSASQRYFGNESPLGKTLTIENTQSFHVTGVFEDIPVNSHFHPDFIASLSTIEGQLTNIWTGLDVVTYLLLREGADPKALEAKFPAMADKYCSPEIKKFTGKTLAELREKGTRWDYFLQPLTSIYLHSDLGFEMEPTSDIKFIYIFSTISVFLLLIAAINFINLTTARSTKRAKEVGVRKTVGSVRSQLIAQFLFESLAMSLLALGAALVMIRIFFPAFTRLIGKEIPFQLFSSPTQLIILITIVLFVGLVAGIYPAFVLSGFRPVSVLKSQPVARWQAHWLRRILVVFQFAVSIILILGTIVIFNQLDFIQNRELGFDKEQVLLIHNANILGRDINPFKETLLQNPKITSATVTSYLPVTSNRKVQIVFPEGKAQDDTHNLQIWRVDADFVTTFGMEITVGRDFSKERSADRNSVIINEAAALSWGWKDPLGKKIGSLVSNDPPKMRYYTVVGVVKDFHYDSLKSKILPLALYLEQSSEFMAVQMDTADVGGVLDFIKERWNTALAGYPIEFSFLDERFDRMYGNERRAGQILSVFAGLALLVGCLGLFGLAAYTAEQRTKEVGIRKVLGAGMPEILLLLYREFGLLVFVGFLVGGPVAYLVMSRWLQDFAYRVGIGVLPFVISGFLVLAIALITVSFYAVRLAFHNPADSLRYE